MGSSHSRLYILVAKYEFGLKIHQYIMKEKSIEMEMGSPFQRPQFHSGIDFFQNTEEFPVNWLR